MAAGLFALKHRLIGSRHKRGALETHGNVIAVRPHYPALDVEHYVRHGVQTGGPVKHHVDPRTHGKRAFRLEPDAAVGNIERNALLKLMSASLIQKLIRCFRLNGVPFGRPPVGF